MVRNYDVRITGDHKRRVYLIRILFPLILVILPVMVVITGLRVMVEEHTCRELTDYVFHGCDCTDCVRSRGEE